MPHQGQILRSARSITLVKSFDYMSQFSNEIKNDSSTAKSVMNSMDADKWISAIAEQCHALIEN